MPAFRYLGGDHGRGLLESALAQPQQTFEGRFLYRTIFDKAAVLFQSLIKDHPLLDGNKRLAHTSVALFLTMNGYLFYVSRCEAIKFTLSIASAYGSPGLKEISRWLRRNSISRQALLAKPPAERNRWARVVLGASGYVRRFASIAEAIVSLRSRT
ncbi:MAG: type II toxin-antitoxin system death-on-curing family toxin [Chloroflexi bacterium]|nr:type II toxin-antitoxin system death-on-curing family toxin [Chloroflexota bacterium]